MSTTVVAEEAVRNAWGCVIDPELGDNVVDLGMLHRIDVDCQSGDVGVYRPPAPPGCYSKRPVWCPTQPNRLTRED